MSLRDVLARLLPDALDGYGDPERWADSFMRDPALAAAERVLAAALDWRMNADRGTADELLLVVMGAVDDYLRAYRSAVEDQP